MEFSYIIYYMIDDTDWKLNVLYEVGKKNFVTVKNRNRVKIIFW